MPTTRIQQMTGTTVDETIIVTLILFKVQLIPGTQPNSQLQVNRGLQITRGILNYHIKILLARHNDQWDRCILLIAPNIGIDIEVAHHYLIVWRMINDK